MDHEGNIKAFNERCGAEGAIEACIARWPEEERVLQACEIVTQEMVSLESQVHVGCTRTGGRKNDKQGKSVRMAYCAFRDKGYVS